VNDIGTLLGDMLRGRFHRVAELTERILDNTLIGWLLPLLLLLGAAWYFLGEGLRAPTRVVMTAGAETSRRHEIARDHLLPAAEEQGLRLVLRPIEGTEQALALVNEGKEVQVALVPGGLPADAYPKVRQVASLWTEPLHLLLKKEVYQQALLGRSLREALAGKRIDRGARGSGTFVLSAGVLARLGLGALDYRDDPRGTADLLAASARVEELPDAIFIVSLLPNQAVTRLVTDFGYRLYPLPFADAFRLEDTRVVAATVPSMTYGIDPPVPDGPLTSIGTHLLVVAHEDTSPDALYLLLDALVKGKVGSLYMPSLSLANLQGDQELELHFATTSYLNDKLPVSRETIQSFQALWGTLLTVVPAALVLVRRQLSRRKQIDVEQRAGRLRERLAELTQIERTAIGMELLPHVDPARVAELRERLVTLKAEALADYEAGNPAVEGLMASFLALTTQVQGLLIALRDRGRAGAARSELLTVAEN
jgi:TRAP-type uncharacterized transport system substrate-binding protein